MWKRELKDRIEDLGLNIKETAKGAGVYPKYIYRLYKGGGTINTLQRIAGSLGMKVVYTNKFTDKTYTLKGRKKILGYTYKGIVRDSHIGSANLFNILNGKNAEIRTIEKLCDLLKLEIHLEES